MEHKKNFGLLAKVKFATKKIMKITIVLNN